MTRIEKSLGRKAEGIEKEKRPSKFMVDGWGEEGGGGGKWFLVPDHQALGEGRGWGSRNGSGKVS